MKNHNDDDHLLLSKFNLDCDWQNSSKLLSIISTMAALPPQFAQFDDKETQKPNDGRNRGQNATSQLPSEALP